GIGQLVAGDQADGLGGDAQAPGHFFLVAADEQPEDVLLKAVGVAGVLALEGRDHVLTVGARRAALEHRLIDPEAGLAPEVEVANDLRAVAELEVGLVVPSAGVTATALGQEPRDFKAVAVTAALVGGDGDPGRQ